MDILDIGAALKKSVAANQGAENFGKILAVGEDGKVVPVNGSGAEVITADDVLYSGSTTYDDGTVGKTLKETAADVSQLKSEITSIIDGQYHIAMEFESGLYAGSPVVGQQVNLTPTANDAWVRCKVAFKKGDVISLYGTASTNTKFYTITNSTDEVVEVTTVTGKPSTSPFVYTAAAAGYLYTSVQLAIAHGLVYSPQNSYDVAVDKAKAYADTSIATVNSRITANLYEDYAEFERGLYSGTPVVGQQVNLTPSINDDWRRCKVKYNSGDKITLWGHGSSTTKVYTITDINGIVLAVSNVADVGSTTPYILNATTSGYIYMSTIASNNYGLKHVYENGFAALPGDLKRFVATRPILPIHFDHDPSGVPLQSDGSNSISMSSLYEFYDDLVETYPDYVTKVDCSDADEVLGLTRPDYLDGYPIYLYKFTPKLTYSTSKAVRKIKLMILTGVHSVEKFNMRNTAHLLKYICEHWSDDQNAMVLRTFIEIWVMPIVNPYGMSHDGRVNYNGVNLNRNAPTRDWILSGTGTTNYSGPSAGSEYETKIWTYYHDLFQPDVFIDQHTPGMPSSGVFGLTETIVNEIRLADVAAVISRSISNNLLLRDGNVPQNPSVALFDSYSVDNIGSTATFAYEHGTRYPFLFEMSEESKWDDGTLTNSVVTPSTSGLMKQEQMQNIYLAWMCLLENAAYDYTGGWINPNI